MLKYLVDFEFTGHIKVEAETEKEAKKLVENMSLEGLTEYIQHFNVGRYYIEKIRE